MKVSRWIMKYNSQKPWPPSQSFLRVSQDSQRAWPKCQKYKYAEPVSEVRWYELVRFSLAVLPLMNTEFLSWGRYSFKVFAGHLLIPLCSKRLCSAFPAGVWLPSGNISAPLSCFSDIHHRLSLFFSLFIDPISIFFSWKPSNNDSLEFGVWLLCFGNVLLPYGIVIRCSV